MRRNAQGTHAATQSGAAPHHGGYRIVGTRRAELLTEREQTFPPPRTEEGFGFAALFCERICRRFGLRGRVPAGELRACCPARARSMGEGRKIRPVMRDFMDGGSLTLSFGTMTGGSRWADAGKRSFPCRAFDNGPQGIYNGSTMKIKSFLTLCAAACILASCSQKDAASSDDGIVIGVATELQSLDPFSSLTAEARSINFNIFDGLVNVGTDGSFLPAIGVDYAMSSDALTHTFTLRRGVLFHDGSEVGADDVLYSIQRAREAGITGYDKIKEARAAGDGTIELELLQPDPGFIACLSTPIVKKGAEDLARHPVGTGPYKVQDFAPGSLTLLRNDAYWGAGGQLRSVRLVFVEKQMDLVRAFKKGKIDGFTSNADVATLLTQETTQYQRNSNSVQLLALNNDFEPFRHQEVRQAVSYLINVDQIIQEACFGYGVKVGSALIPALSKYYDMPLVGSYQRNLAKAKELLQEAGYAAGFKFTIVVPETYSVHVQTARVIARQLADAGIKASVKKVSWPDWLSGVYKGRNYEATVISLDGGIAYPTAYLSRYVSGAGNNFVNYSSARYDEAYERAVSAIDEGERIEWFKRAQRILNEECASVFIQDISTLTVYSTRFAGNRDYPLYATDFTAIYRVYSGN